MMESWNVGRLGMKSGKRSILQKILYLHFMMMPVRHPFSAFAPENTPILQENQYNYIRFDFLNPPSQNSRTHDSIIPLFQLRSEAELSSVMIVYRTIQKIKRFVQNFFHFSNFLCRHKLNCQTGNAHNCDPMENPVSLDKTGLVSYSDHIMKMTTMIT